MTWEKLNFLVPNPQCETVEGVVTRWFDSRPEPPQAAIDAVTEVAIVAREKAEAFDKDVAQFSPAMKAMFDQLETEMPGFQGRTKTKHDTP